MLKPQARFARTMVDFDPQRGGKSKVLLSLKAVPIPTRVLSDFPKISLAIDETSHDVANDVRIDVERKLRQRWRD